MFADPLRAAMARRLVWRIEGEAEALALPTPDGLCALDGEPVPFSLDERVSLWHPADDPVAQALWNERLLALGVDQPIDQVSREVILADDGSPSLPLVSGRLVDQTQMRGFLLNRGWRVPFLGHYSEVPEARRPMTPHGPLAVLMLEYAAEDRDDLSNRLILGDLVFRSVREVELDARELPPEIVSEAARDVLGAAKAAEVDG